MLHSSTIFNFFFFFFLLAMFVESMINVEEICKEL